MKKYKLINTETKEETLCDKVIIDGFDYYVSNEIPKEDDVATIPSYASLVIVGSIDDMPYSESHRHWQGLFCDTCFDVEAVSKFKKVIATNNPNIDVPRVVDKAELLAKNIYRDNPTDKKGVSYKYNTDINAPRKRKAFVKGYHKSQETHPFSEEDMIEFAIFYEKNQGKSLEYWGKDLFKIWNEQRIKTLYYE